MFGAGLDGAQAAHGQTDLELAEFYYNEGSYPQAKLYLEGIWKKNKTNAVYQMYYATLLALDDFDTAEKVVKERLKRRHKNSRSTALVDLGSLYLHFDKRDSVGGLHGGAGRLAARAAIGGVLGQRLHQTRRAGHGPGHLRTGGEIGIHRV